MALVEILACRPSDLAVPVTPVASTGDVLPAGDAASDDDTASEGDIASDGDAEAGADEAWQCLPGDPLICERTPGPEFVLVSPGTFVMGSPVGELGRDADEIQHQVTLTRGYWLQKTEVTQGQFEDVMAWNPSWYSAGGGSGVDCGADCPVERVSAFDLMAYLNEWSLRDVLAPCYLLTDVVCADATNAGVDYLACMNSLQGGISSAVATLNGVTSVYDCEGFRLPTEAEWEYAARAGDARTTYNGDLTAETLTCEQPNPTLDPIAWFCGHSGSTTHPTATLAANAGGIHDMLGNVWEWCGDLYSNPTADPLVDPEGADTGTDRVLRGGSWQDDAESATAANRSGPPSDPHSWEVGGRACKSF